ncbi:MAG: YrdB family protein [Chloroflexota bacterium]
MIGLLKNANLALAFLLELVAVGAFAYFGFTVSDSTLLNVVLGIGLALLSIVLWGIFAAPKSTRRLRGNALLIFKLVFFALSVIALVLAGSVTLGIVFGVLVAINLVLASTWEQEQLGV